MGESGPQPEMPRQEPTPEPEMVYRALDRRKEIDLLAEFTPNTSQKLIGMGLNSKAVVKYYQNNISGITTEEMAETLGELLREVIESY